MSLQHRQNKNTVKKINLDEVDEGVSNVTKYKRCAILKYCDGNGIKRNHLDKLSISNYFHILGLYHFV